MWDFRHTKIEEWGVGVEHLDTRLFVLADSMVDVARALSGNDNIKIHINCAWADGKGHVANSLHYVGKAFDGYLYVQRDVLKIPIPLWFQYMVGMKVRCTGFGIYPDWHSPGFHLEIEDLLFPVPKKTWMQRFGLYRQVTGKDLVELMTLAKDEAQVFNFNK